MKRHPIRILLLVALVAGLAFAVNAALRGKRLIHTAKDWRKDIRYLVETGETIGEAPAADVFESGYLEAMFGGDPELLTQLRSVISKGLAEDPTLNMGEVAAMIITYRKNSEDRVYDVVAHVIGGFPLGIRKPGFHRDGFFDSQIDKNLWNTGNSLLAFFGRDIALFADESVANKQQNILESILSGDILPLVDMIRESPIYYTAVFPDPRRIFPQQLRPHIQALVLKGYLAPYEGSYDITFLTPKPESANYLLSMIYDMKLAAQLGLQGRFEGVIHDKGWGEYVPVWWAYEMSKNLSNVTLEKQANIVHMHLDFARVMVNATLKSVERMGRDMSQMRSSLDEKLDPRLADARLRSEKPTHYWGDSHRWGPDWPIAAPSTNGESSVTSEGAPFEAPAVSPAE